MVAQFKELAKSMEAGRKRKAAFEALIEEALRTGKIEWMDLVMGDSILGRRARLAEIERMAERMSERKE